MFCIEARIISPIFAIAVYIVIPTILLLINYRFYKIDIKFPLIFSGIAALIILASFYFLILYDAWYVNSNYIRPLNISVEEIIFSFFWPLSIVTIYDMICKQRRTVNHKNLNKFLLIAAILVTLTIISVIANIKQFFELPYSYLVIYTIYMIPIIFIGRKFFSKNLLFVAIFNFIISMAFEIFALSEDWWVFEGQYLFNINLFNLQFPFEELFFWMILGGIWVAILYDYTFRRKGVIG